MGQWCDADGGVKVFAQRGAVYNGVHLSLAEATGAGRDVWRRALDAVEALGAQFVVAGHKVPTRADDPAKILPEYGLVIVDECHHVAAKTFAAAIRSIPARRWLGLTATPKRPDRREEIMFMHCGTVRHKIPSETDLVQELYVHPTATTIREDVDSEIPGILQSIIIPALVSDRTRTAQIVDDVVRAIRRGRNCLVMAGRTEAAHTATIENVPAYRHAAGVRVQVPHYGEFTGDVAWGGNWFFLIKSHGHELRLENVDALTEFTWAVRRALTSAGIKIAEFRDLI